MNYQTNSDYDSAWKEAITVYLEQFIEYCFPEVYQDIDWEKGYETLDTELQELIRDAETGRRLADKLVKVTLRNGEKALVLIHIEIQGQEQEDFAERMYIRHLQKRNYGTYLWGQGEAFGISRCLIFPLNYRPNASPLQLMTN
ncbi:hypothetical protein H5968_07930 [Sphaerospermopsis sp. LEGE 00249]|uniref:hypothetical protein n=1 Tax=Sphaerospermopsis sp. LEGE 00249 TaxID=1380707 RepID=UPI00164D7B44|nr:hypothetical protein [Sphaerospermopsis sp. LEGE 00249]MBC5795077.1 hypothetical protein [Sphaerospermopsis sp. LEGE 00249]